MKPPYKLEDYYTRESFLDRIFPILLGSIILWGIIICVLVPLCEGATNFDEHMAVKAVIGEASDQGYKGMLAVSCAIRNRGTLKGVFGLKAPHVKKEPKWVWDLATKAWRDSAKYDVTKGADHWENVEDFGEPYWAPKLVKTVKVGKHQFYK